MQVDGESEIEQEIVQAGVEQGSSAATGDKSHILAFQRTLLALYMQALEEGDAFVDGVKETMRSLLDGEERAKEDAGRKLICSHLLRRLVLIHRSLVHIVYIGTCSRRRVKRRGR